jgi:hypothetical protein
LFYALRRQISPLFLAAAPERSLVMPLFQELLPITDLAVEKNKN